MKKPGRNDDCPCGSGKKFKKCCESSMISGRFKAEKIQQVSTFGSASKVTSFFKNHLSSAAPAQHLEEKGEQM